MITEYGLVIQHHFKIFCIVRWKANESDILYSLKSQSQMSSIKGSYGGGGGAGVQLSNIP